MVVFIPEKIKKTGKDYFFDRLSVSLTRSGTKVTRNPVDPHDISLQAIFIEKTNTRKYVLRLNGVHHNTAKPWQRINKSIVDKGLEHANGVVYQSQFSNTMCDKYLGTFKGPKAVIFNGAPIYRFNKHGMNVLAVSKWRPHKRLEDIIESFLLTKASKISGVKLIIVGGLEQTGILQKKLGEYFKLSNVEFRHTIGPGALKEILQQTQVGMHLCWFDNCPNSVVETLVAGIPVITNNVGGTCEIVNDNCGMVLKIDSDYNYGLVKLYEPPIIDRVKVAEAIDDYFPGGIKFGVEVISAHVNIKEIAKQYLNFFQKVLR